MAGRLRAFKESCPSSKRGTLKRKLTNIRRDDSGQRKQYGVQRVKLHRAAVGAYIQEPSGRSAVLAHMRDWLASHIGVSVTREATRKDIKKELRKKCVRKYKTFYISSHARRRREEPRGSLR